MNSKDYLENRDEYLSTKDIALDIESLRRWINKIIDKLLYFGIRNEEIDLTEIKLYLIQKDYCDITKCNIRNYKKENK